MCPLFFLKQQNSTGQTQIRNKTFSLTLMFLLPYLWSPRLASTLQWSLWSSSHQGTQIFACAEPFQDDKLLSWPPVQRIFSCQLVWLPGWSPRRLLLWTFTCEPQCFHLTIHTARDSVYGVVSGNHGNTASRGYLGNHAASQGVFPHCMVLVSFKFSRSFFLSLLTFLLLFYASFLSLFLPFFLSSFLHCLLSSFLSSTCFAFVIDSFRLFVKRNKMRWSRIDVFLTTAKKLKLNEILTRKCDTYKHSEKTHAQTEAENQCIPNFLASPFLCFCAFAFPCFPLDFFLAIFSLPRFDVSVCKLETTVCNFRLCFSTCLCLSYAFCLFVIRACFQQ